MVSSLIFRLIHFVLVIFFCICQSCYKKQNSKITIDPYPLEKILDNYVENGIWPFLYSRIEEGKTGEVVFEHLAINDSLLPNTTINGDTWIRIWSMTKLVTISIAMDLIEESFINMDEPVTKYIPEFSNLMVAVDINGESIAFSEDNKYECPHELVKVDSIMKIKHLFNHRAGFYYALTKSSCLNDWFASSNVIRAKNGEELIKILANLPLIQQPGESYYYGMNTTVLGLLLERATGKSLQNLFLDRIANPHNIDNMSFIKPKDVSLIPSFTGRDGTLRKIRTGELDIFGGEVPLYLIDNKLFLGGEGMLGTARGYINFMRLLFFNDDDSFLNKSTVRKMSSKPDAGSNNFGYNTGYGSYLTSKTHEYEKDILRVGGYEKTGSWVDRKNNLIGALISQANETQDKNGLGTRMEEDFKRELYWQLNKN